MLNDVFIVCYNYRIGGILSKLPRTTQQQQRNEVSSKNWLLTVWSKGGKIINLRCKVQYGL